MAPPNTNRTLTITQPAFLVNGSDAEFRSLINKLLYFSARLLAVRDGFGTLIGLSGVQFSILLSIKQLSAEGEVTVNQLADHLHFSGSFVTVETGKLQKRGLIAKRPHLLDRRKMVLSITEEGFKLLDRLAETQYAVNDILFDKLSARDFAQLHHLFSQMVTNSDAAMLELSHLISKLNIQQEAVKNAEKA
ncbi:MAG: MarR family transcriptional regulator [Pigmentiphaga sp.]|nr:MarR family transcriptional regulator [Pigmentiphaga sp.]